MREFKHIAWIVAAIANSVPPIKIFPDVLSFVDKMESIQDFEIAKFRDEIKAFSVWERKQSPDALKTDTLVRLVQEKLKLNSPMAETPEGAM